MNDNDDNIFVESEKNKGNLLIDCKDSCNSNGLCRNYKCFCSPDFTGEACEISISQYLETGIFFKDAKYYLLGATFVGIILGYMIIQTFNKKSKFTEYKNFK